MQQPKRESWASSIGVILAVAGSAVGLGNFLRFPGQVAQHGGGAFLIPYFISFLIIGLPIMWLEWNMGRYGGIFGHGSPIGGFNVIFRKPWAKYIASTSVLSVLFVSFYYLYLESILLGYAWYSITGLLTDMAAAGKSAEFFTQYLTFDVKFLGMPAALFFLFITVGLNIGVLSFGVVGGIEKLAKILMPMLLMLGVVLLIRVLTLPGAIKGMAFMWNPNFSDLLKPETWLAAAGQIFFTLSIGMASIANYASYVKRNEDVVLSSLAASATNEFAEVILGGSIIIPAAAAILGTSALGTIVEGGTFGLGLITMPAMLSQIPFDQLFATIWFLLLFFAGITSSISMFQPVISFCSDELQLPKKISFCFIVVIAASASIFVAMDSSLTRLDEIDFWGGNFLLLVFGTIEAVLFSCLIDSKKGWIELHRGAKVCIPDFYRVILKYITPGALLLILGSWLITEGPARFSMDAYPEDKKAMIFVTRMILFGLAIGLNILIAYAWKTKKIDDRLNMQVEDPIHE
ncbi:MAG: sodium-dependent transporter [Brevinema sp.]